MCSKTFEQNPSCTPDRASPLLELNLQAEDDGFECEPRTPQGHLARCKALVPLTPVRQITMPRCASAVQTPQATRQHLLDEADSSCCTPSSHTDMNKETGSYTPKKVETLNVMPKAPKRQPRREPKLSQAIRILQSDDGLSLSLPTNLWGRSNLPHAKNLCAAPVLLPVPKSFYEEHFMELEHVGDGSFGSVFKVCSRDDGQIYAVKQICNRQPMAVRLREAFALQKCNGPENVISFQQHWVEGNTLFLQMEFFEGGSLIDQRPVGSTFWTEEGLRALLLQISMALAAVHQRGFAHLDVKLENMYVRKGMDGNEIFVLGDFGLACDVQACQDEESLHQNDYEGDSRYLCQFLLNSNAYLREADIFSLGASIYELARGWALDNSGDDWQRIRKGDLHGIEHCSTELQQLLHSMMDPVPWSRPSAVEVIQRCHAMNVM